MPGPRRRIVGGEAEHGPSVLFSVERTPVMRLARSLSNRTWERGAYGAIYRANLRIAQAVQAQAITNLRATIVRPLQSTGNLEDAIGDPRAVYADAQRIIIGVGDFLDAKASYWRAVEFGAPNLKGRTFYGFWTNAPRSDGGAVRTHGPMWGIKTGRPIVMSVDQPPEVDFSRGGGGRRPFFTWTIQNPTEAHWYFANAWRSVGESGLFERAYRAEFAQVLGPNGKPIILGQRFRAYFGRSLERGDFGD